MADRGGTTRQSRGTWQDAAIKGNASFTVGKQRFGLSAARLIGGEGVNQNIGVEDTARRPSRPTWN
jgi:hypothetical protein